jgi:hypothetical protein
MQEVKIPESFDDFKNDIRVALLAMLNQARFVFFREDQPTDDSLWALLSARSPTGSFSYPDNGPQDLDLSWADVENVAFAVSMQALYNYGVLALVDQSEPLGDNEEPANWVYKIICDFRKSSFLIEWSDLAGDNVLASVTRCWMVCELALARQALEDVDETYTQGETSAPHGHLTIFHMALLAGVTEQSLRSMISRKGELQTVKVQANDRIGANSSFIEITHAKDWLKAKGKYAPIRTISSRGAMPLTLRRFTDLEDFQEAVQARIEYLMEEEGELAIATRLGHLGLDFEAGHRGNKQYLSNLTVTQLLDEKLMHELGEALALIPDAMRLRAAELAHGLRLAQVERELKQINN